MATPEEKQKALKDLLGGDEELFQTVMTRLEAKEKEADKYGLAYKAKKTAPPPPADEEADSEDEMSEESMEDSEEESTESEDEEDLEEEEENPKGKKKEAPEYMGDLPVEEFAEKLAGVLAGTVEPYLQDIQAVKAEVASLKELITSKNKENASALAQVAGQDKKIADQAKLIENLQTQVKELMGDQPRGVQRGFIASQATTTEVPEERAKELGVPTADPVASFYDFVLQPPKA